MLGRGCRWWPMPRFYLVQSLVVRLLVLRTFGPLRFFFSSIRRHTMLQGDWSSDVCSSDLEEAFHEEASPYKEASCAKPLLLFSCSPQPSRRLSPRSARCASGI